MQVFDHHHQGLRLRCAQHPSAQRRKQPPALLLSRQSRCRIAFARRQFQKVGDQRCAEIVRVWIENPPHWLEVRVAPAIDDGSLQPLDDGQRAAIALAVALKADFILMDDRAGVAVARSKGFAVTGRWDCWIWPLGASWSSWTKSLDDSKATNFRYSPEIMDTLLVEADEERKE
jgi:predicted nucleic acid-binding protein